MVIFVAGNSRSGTTMMGRVLGAHPDVHTFQELHFFDEIAGSPGRSLSQESAIEMFARLMSIDKDGYFAKRDTSKYRSDAAAALHGKSYFEPMQVYEIFLRYTVSNMNKKHPCEQTPQNVFYISEILEMFKDAKIILMVRDPRDVMLSQKNKWKRRKLTSDNYPWIESFRARLNYHPIVVSKIWKSVNSQIRALKDDTRVLVIRYEDLVLNSTDVVKKACLHSEIEFAPEMLTIPVKGSSNESDNLQREGIIKERMGKWRNGGLNAAEIAICQNMLKDEMKIYGYKVENIKYSNPFFVFYYFTLPVKLTLAVIFNLKRFQDVRKAFKKLVA